MRTTRTRKLVLSRESLVQLTETGNVAGGDIPRFTETCQTCKFCPLQTFDALCYSRQRPCLEA